MDKVPLPPREKKSLENDEQEKNTSVAHEAAVRETHYL